MMEQSLSSILKVQSVFKRYHTQPVLQDISFELVRSQIIALLGPSGCGKTTTLRMIAGFDQPDSGSVELEGDLVAAPSTFIPPEHRKVGMVFQDFALFPHLSIFENIAFGLKKSGINKKERVSELLELIGLTGFEKKMPHMISGGQQQRVALARALAPKPKLILMDEPFSSLDAQLRVQLREEIRRILKKEEVAAILVTHDQQEAFTFADKVLLMNGGRIEQSGTPETIYENPVSHWSACFSGITNSFDFKVEKDQGNFILGQFSLPENYSPQGQYQLVIRPEDLNISTAVENSGNAEVQNCQFWGTQKLFELKLKNSQLVKVLTHPREDWKVGDRVQLGVENFQIVQNK